MAVKTVLTQNNIGSGLETTSEPNKFNPVIQGVSSDAGNVLTNGTDGKPALTGAAIKANETVTTLVVDTLAKTFTYTNEAGTAVTVDLVALGLTIDVNVVSITDDGNGTYSFVQDDGGPTVVLDLSTMLKLVAMVDSLTVTLTGDGTAIAPLRADVNVSYVAGNLITVQADGLHAAQTPFSATSADGSITATPAGTAGHTPDLVVNTTIILPTELVEWGTGAHIGQIGL